MSVTAIPYGETVDKYLCNESIKKARTLASYKFHGRTSPLREQWARNRNENTTKFFPPISCDPLLDLVNLDDFHDHEKLQRNFEEVSKIHKMGFPLKIVKQSWFPGLICIPIFHCQRCLALWTQAAQVPNLCSEVNRSVHGRLIPISITKCDLLTKLLNDRKATATRLCKQLPVTKLVKPELKPEKPAENSFGKKVFRPIPVAEFVDIDKQLRKYRRKFMRELKGIGSEQRRMFWKTTGRASSPLNDYGSESKTKAQGRDSSPVDDYGSEDKVQGIEVQGGIACVAGDGEGRVEEVDSKCGTEVCNKDASVANQDFKFNPKYNNARMHDKSCFLKPNKSGYKARPSTSVQKSRLEKGLAVTSKNEATKPFPAATIPTKLVPRQTTNIKRSAPRTRRPRCRQLTSTEVPLDVTCGKKPEEPRQEALVFDKQALKVVFGERLETVFGRKLEKLDANLVNSDWFQSLVEDFGKQGEQLRTYRNDLTRSFCFSYFELLRKD